MKTLPSQRLIVALVLGMAPALAGVGFAQTTQIAAPPAPTYVVVEGQSPEAANPTQTLTVLCPSTHRALGAGYAALVRVPSPPGQTQPLYREVGLDRVRSMPDSAGGGWQIEGFSQEAATASTPWKLAVRVVCLRAPN